MTFHLSRVQRLYLVTSVSLLFFLAELTVGLTTRSLALIADAFHYLNDFISFIVALVAVKLTDTKDFPEKLSFGWQRAEPLGAFFNGVFLLASGISIFIQSVERFILLQRVKNPKLILIIGCIGLALNVISATFLHGHNPERIDSSETNALGEVSSTQRDSRHNRQKVDIIEHDLGMLGVLIHVIGDALNNLGVIVMALVIWRTDYGGRFYADPAVSMAISFMIFMTSLPLVKKSAMLLLGTAPDGVDLNDIRHDLQMIPGIISVRDLQIWRLNQHKSLASVHILLSECKNSDFIPVTNMVKECFHQYGIHSATIQPEIAANNIEEATTADAMSLSRTLALDVSVESSHM